MTRLLLSSSVLFAIACGSSEPTPATGPSPTAGEKPAGEHHRLTPELHAFHELLSPLWHAPAGEPRRKDTCAAVPDFKTRAEAVKGAAAPATADPVRWSEAGGQLVAAVGRLEAACGAADPGGFEAAFEAVHTRFHHAMELVAGEHDMQGEHAGDHEGRGEHEAGAGRGQKEGDHTGGW